MSLVADIFSSITRRKIEIAQEPWDRYAELCKAIALEESVDADEVANLVELLGRTEAQVQKDVEIVRRRLEAKPLADDLQKALRQTEAASQDWDKVREQWRTVQAEWNAKLDAAQAKLNAAASHAQRCREAKTLLCETGLPNPKREKEYTDIHGQMIEAVAELRQIESRIADLSARINSDLSHLGSKRPAERIESQAKIDSGLADLAELKKELSAAKIKRDGLEAERQKHLAKSLEI